MIFSLNSRATILAVVPPDRIILPLEFLISLTRFLSFSGFPGGPINRSKYLAD